MEVEEDGDRTASSDPSWPSTTYRDAKGRKKTVSYWAMELPRAPRPRLATVLTSGVGCHPRKPRSELTWDRDRSGYCARCRSSA